MRVFYPHRKEVVSEISSFEDAVAAAYAESGETNPDDSVAGLSLVPEEAEAVVDQASDALGDQSTTDESNVDELFSVDDVEEEVTEQPTTNDIENMTFVIPGHDEPVGFAELRDGYLRQSDYTRKTQEVAAQRKDTGDAVKFYEAIQADPAGVIASLAKKVGLISDDAVSGELDVSPVRTNQELESELERRVAEAVELHPDVVSSRRASQVQAITSELDRIAETHGVKLGPESRKAILMTAQARGVSDLELVYEAMAAKRAEAKSGSNSLKLAAGQRKGNAGSEDETPPTINSFEDAWRVAEAMQTA